jgi:AAA15 family ATPase/GTPase
MRIEKFSFHNHATGWQLAPMEFDAVNLLVGVSGVGKTKILAAIQLLRQIIFGNPWHNNIFNGVEWDITFSTSSEAQYRWHGKFSQVNNLDYTIDQSGVKRNLEIEHHEPELEIETLWLNGDCIIQRSGASVTFKGSPLPNLSPSESLVGIFRTHEEVNPVIDAWLLVINSQVQNPNRWVGSSMPDETEDLSLSDIRRKNITLVDRLGLLWINDKEIFNQIKSNFIELFPQVEDLRILIENYRRTEWNDSIATLFSLELKEVGVDNWITQSNISMGMLKTLTHLTEIQLLAAGSVLLIDEFENSLGVNCVDVVTDLLNKRKDIQFIMTSHHPYIINKISMQYWQIITRKGSLVTATKATEYEELSGSRHKAFSQLINLSDYIEGIQVG